MIKRGGILVKIYVVEDTDSFISSMVTENMELAESYRESEGKRSSSNTYQATINVWENGQMIYSY